MAITQDMNDTKRWDAFCERLAEKTTQGDLTWYDCSSDYSRENTTSPLYVAEYKTWHILIYGYRYKYYLDELDYNWLDDIAVELIDEQGRVLWRVPNVASRYDLLESVQFSKQDINALLNDVLGETP